MTIQEIYHKAQQVIGLNGMTINERLWTSGLIDEFDHAKKYDKSKAETILKALQVDKNSIRKIMGTIK
ncbi:hypothetical protein ED312_04635 [Sinomicrobium pectinilyticum]|uniref:Uncharacterized protein n=2 Tax=Sinomicrobium pectinilyticum TaxID=1084421 RepID=A0A3N0EU83_SINP1|nr:hypothetical protein ED312_04635 [Sinomicrobium pectinilyticum]